MARTFFKRAARTSAVLLLLALVVVVLAVFWLKSSGGQAFLRDQVVAATRDAIAGRLEFDRVDFVDGHLVIEGLELYTPEGALVARVGRLELDVDVAAAVRKDFRVSRVKLDRVHLELVEDARGLNLTRAVAARTPVANDGRPAAPVHLTIEDVELSDSDVSFTDGARTVRLEALGGVAKAVVGTQPFSVVSSLRLEGVGTAPVKGPVTLVASTTSPTGDALHVVTDLRFADEVVKGSFDWPGASVELDEVRVTPALVKGLTGSDALRQTVVLKGRASPSGADLTAAGGAAKLKVKGAWNLEQRTVSSLSLEADDVNLAEWLAGGAPSRLAVKLEGQATDTSLEHLTAALTGTARWASPSGRGLATAELDLSAKAGQGQVKRVEVKAPGVSVSLSGRASMARLDLSGALSASDLSRLDATVSEFTGTHLPPLAGRGSLSLDVVGPTTHPKVVATGALDDLRVATLTTKRLVLDVTVPDVTRPLDTDGTLAATRLTIGQQTLDEVRAGVTTHGRELDVALTTKGLGDVGLALHGTLDADSEGAALASLELDTGVDRWSLREPTRVAWGRVTKVESLRLAAGRQALELSAELRGRAVTASVHAVDVDVGRLPRVLVPQSLGVAGVVSLDAKVGGSLPVPTVDAKLSVAGGAVQGVAQLAGAVEATFDDWRLTGKVDLGSSLGGVAGRFDVPLRALRDETSDGLEVDLELKDVGLEAIQSWRAETWPVTGTLSAHVSAKGPANDPAVTVTVRSDRFTVTRSGALEKNLVLEPVALTVATKAGAEPTLSARVECTTLGAAVTASLDTPFTVAGLRHHAPTPDELRHAALTADLEVAPVALEALAGLGVEALAGVSGRASVRGHVVGSVDDPHGQVTLRFERVSAAPLEDLEGTLELTAGNDLTRLVGTGKVGGRPLYELDLFVDTTLARLQHLDALGSEHVTGHVSVTPLSLATLLPRRDDDVMPTGFVSLELDVKGSLDEPKLTIDGTVQNLNFGRVPLGQARLVSRTQGAGQAVGLTLKTNEGELRATGTVGVDLSLPALRKGLAVRAIPLDLSVSARTFDLSFLSGVTPMVRVVGGQLEVHDFKVTGLLGNPDVHGTVAWKKGRLGLASYGDYRDIELETVLARERVEVNTLSVRAGGGGFAMDPMVAVRRPTGGWAFESSGTATRFPIVTDDQLLAILGVKYELAGELTDTTLELPKLVLSRVDVELPEVKRKDIQDLERPKDLVIVRGGRTIAGRRRGEAQQTATSGGGRTFSARVTAPRNVWLRSTDLNLELGLSEDFRVENAGETQLFGEARVLGGRIDVIGREFKVNRVKASTEQQSEATVRFAGPAKEPYVNVTAQHVNDREKVTVTVNVVGRGTDVQLKVSSNPTMSESEIYALLATGRRDLRRSSGSSITPEQAVSVIGSLAANQLKTALLKRLPIDIVDVVSIDTGSEGLESTRVEVGKYLSDSFYLGYVGQPGANKARGESVHTGRLEMQVSKDVSVQVSGGVDAPAFGGDIVWSRDF